MTMLNRTFGAGTYRFQYQGSEQDREITNGNNSNYTTEFRGLDVRLGRWLSPDLITHPSQSPYCSMDNNPIALTDVLGLSTGEGEGGSPVEEGGGGRDGTRSPDSEPTTDGSERFFTRGENTTTTTTPNNPASINAGYTAINNSSAGVDFDKILNNKDLKEMYNTYKDAKGMYDKLEKYQKYGKAIDDLMGMKSTNSPKEMLDKLETLYSAVSGLLPASMSFGIFTAEFEAVMPMVKEQLYIIQEGLQARDKEIAIVTGGQFSIVHPGAWPGGWAMYEWMKKIKDADSKQLGTMKTPDEIIEYVKDHSEMFEWVTGIHPPFYRKSLFGVNALWPDDDSESWLTPLYFKNHFNEIQTLLYGDLKVK